MHQQYRQSGVLNTKLTLPKQSNSPDATRTHSLLALAGVAQPCGAHHLGRGSASQLASNELILFVIFYRAQCNTSRVKLPWKAGKGCRSPVFAQLFKIEDKSKQVKKIAFIAEQQEPLSTANRSLETRNITTA